MRRRHFGYAVEIPVEKVLRIFRLLWYIEYILYSIWRQLPVSWLIWNSILTFLSLSLSLSYIYLYLYDFSSYNQAKPKTDVEARVYEVLSHKNWGASTTLMNEIARDTFDLESFHVVTRLMWDSVENQRPAAWKVVFKGLTLLEHLVKNGAERCVDDARNHGHVLRSLGTGFNYYEGTIDRGLGVREKTKQILEILGDDERIREERQKARKLREKFSGKQSTASSGGGGGGQYAGYGNQDSWNNSSGGGGDGDGGGNGGYGQGGIDADGSPYSGRYGGSTTTASSSAAPTFAAVPPKKTKKKKKKSVAAAAPEPAPAPGKCD